MKNSAKKFGQSGATIIETVVALGVIVFAITGSQVYFSQVKSKANSGNAVGAASDIESTVVAFTRTVIAEEAKTNPCLKNKVLATEVANQAGPITNDLKVEVFNSNHVTDYVNFLKKAPTNQFADVFTMCRSLADNQACIVIEPKNTSSGSRQRLAVAIISQQAFDFKSGSPADSNTCDNAKVLNPAETDNQYTGIGIKAGYVLLTATRATTAGQTSMEYSKRTGQVLHTLPKYALISGSSSFDPSRSINCGYAFCMDPNSIPPDPGVDYKAWSKYKGPSTYASNCKKCETAPDYR